MNEVYKAVGVSKQSFFQHYQRQELFDKQLSLLIIAMNELREQHPGCGLEKAYYSLKPGFLGRDRFISILQDRGYGVRQSRKFVRTTQPVHLGFGNLIEGMIIYSTNMVWQSDITYYPVGDVFFYIVFITDVFSRLIISHQVSNHMRAEANLTALRKAIGKRDTDLAGLIHHSDHGSQYGQYDYIKLLRENQIHISMGSRGQDNAYAERVNGIIKNEFLKYRDIKTLEDLKKATQQAVTYYNNTRTHNSLPGRIAPAEFERNYVDKYKDLNLAELVYCENPFQHKWSGLGPFKLEGIEESKIMCPIELNNY